MIALWIALGILAGVSAYLAGVYTGIWLIRKNREVITREVEKIVPTEKVVIQEVARIVQVPTQQPREMGGMAVIGQHGNRSVVDQQTMEANSRMQQLIRDGNAEM